MDLEGIESKPTVYNLKFGYAFFDQKKKKSFMAHYSSLTFYLDNWEKILIIKKKNSPFALHFHPWYFSKG